jgi:hypothetical protein
MEESYGGNLLRKVIKEGYEGRKGGYGGRLRRKEGRKIMEEVYEGML